MNKKFLINIKYFLSLLAIFIVILVLILAISGILNRSYGFIDDDALIKPDDDDALIKPDNDALIIPSTSLVSNETNSIYEDKSLNTNSNRSRKTLNIAFYFNVVPVDQGGRIME